MASKPEELEADLAAVSAVAEGVCYTRDLVNKPSNILTTTTFALAFAAATATVALTTAAFALAAAAAMPFTTTASP